MKVERIAVLGAGNGGLAIAADMTLAGFAVRLFELPEFSKTFEPVQKDGVVRLGGVSRVGEARLEVATTDINAAVSTDVDVIIVCVPSFGVARMSEVLAPVLRDGQVVVFLPGAFAAWVAHRVFQRAGVTADVTLAEVATLPYGCRKSGAAEVTVFINAIRLPAAAFPASRTEEVIEALRQLYPQVEPAVDILDTALKNINPCIHPAPTILNTGRIEHADDFYLYAEGMTPSTRRVMVAVDQERIAVREALGLGAPHYGLDPTPGVYEVFEHYFGKGGIYTAGVKMRGPLHMRDRYVTEDVPYGLVFYAAMGDLAGVDTPVCDALIELASVINGEDYKATGFSLDNLGLTDLTVAELRALLATRTTSSPI